MVSREEMPWSQTDIINQSTWIGTEDLPLFGMLSFPASCSVRGGVIIAPPVGFEARAARRALRKLAILLAEHDFIALRFDYLGTGDSSGDFGSALPNPQWLIDVEVAASYLRELGVQSVSAVGMRLGATIVGVAANHRHLDLESFVAWDPCETGRSYLRELGALESLRRKIAPENEDGVVETAEFLFSQEMANSMRKLKLSEFSSANDAKRCLVVTREHRPLSSSLKDVLAKGKVEFESTSEQESLIDVHPFFAKIPDSTISRIVSWIAKDQDSTYINIEVEPRTTVHLSGKNANISEHALQIGPRGLFAITSEPVGVSSGPRIVLLGGIHEDHTGPSRLWVELSRRWAEVGLRCTRLDVSGMGESARLHDDPPMQTIDQIWINDVTEIGRSLSPADPSDCVYVGMCSGAFLALQAAFESGARGLCLINPTGSTDYAHAIARLEKSSSKLAHWFAITLKGILEPHPLLGSILWYFLRRPLPRRWSTDVTRTILSRGTDIYVLATPDELSPYQNVPMLRRFSRQRPNTGGNYPFIHVAGLDHDMTFAEGRKRTAELMQDYVARRYGSGNPTNQSTGV
jgi:pimeloyl-ACP methyl ester carboxylesterase